MKPLQKKSPRVLLAVVLLPAALLLEIWLALQLLQNSELVQPVQWSWLGWHALASMALGFAVSTSFTHVLQQNAHQGWHLVFALSFFIPFAGALAATIGLIWGVSHAGSRVQDHSAWEATPIVDLPFAVPEKKVNTGVDHRGVIEQLYFERESESLYQRLVSIKHMNDSDSAPILRAALAHEGEKIRLVAFSMLDKHIKRISDRINELESRSDSHHVDYYLNLASLYWELLNLEGHDQLMKEQILGKVRNNAAKALKLEPGNVNVLLLLGQTQMELGNLNAAKNILLNCIDSGMPKQKVLPYLAEVAYRQRQFDDVRHYIDDIGAVFSNYPPLKQLSGYWR